MALGAGVSMLSSGLERLDVQKLALLTDLFGILANVTAEAANNINTMGKGLLLMGAGFGMMAVNPLALALAPALLGGGAVKNAATGGTAAAKGTGGGQKLLPLTVKVELEGKKLGEFVKDVVVKELNYNQG